LNYTWIRTISNTDIDSRRFFANELKNQTKIENRIGVSSRPRATPARDGPPVRERE